MNNFFKTFLLASIFFITGLISNFFHESKFPGGNAILISLDSLRVDKLNPYGFGKYPSSQELDKFAKDAIQFSNCFTREADSQSFQFCLFKGIDPKRSAPLDPGQSSGNPTFVDVLKENGYAVHAFVDQGYPRQGAGFPKGIDSYNDGAGNSRGIASEALDFINAYSTGKPFFLYMHSSELTPKGNASDYKSPKPFRGKFSKNIPSAKEGREYLEAVYSEKAMFLDRHLGKIFNALKEKGLYNRSLIIVTSSHGEGLLDHQSFLHDELYDHTIRIPLLVKLPNNAHAMRIRTSLSMAQDIGPTILDLLGLPIPQLAEGASLVSTIEKNKTVRERVFARSPGKGPGTQAVRTLAYKYIYDPKTGEEMLFNVLKDPREKKNLAGVEVGIKEDLKAKLREWSRGEG